MKPFELELFPKLGVKVFSIIAGKLQSKFTRHTIPALLKFPIGFIQAVQLVHQIRPDIVLSFGGFASVPVVFAAALMRIPIVVQEQIVGAGHANKFTSYFATKIMVARKESLVEFPKNKTVLLGNPLMKEILKVNAKTHLPKTPVIYVTGGSRGSQRVNRVVFQSLPHLLPKYRIIHQTGLLDYAEAKDIRESLPRELKEHYELHDFVNPLTISRIYSDADIVVGRAGANTVAEIIAMGIPALFIPIPWTKADEQTKNARYAESLGIAQVLLEVNLTKENFLSHIETIHKTWHKMIASVDRDTNQDRIAAHSLAQYLLKILP